MRFRILGPLQVDDAHGPVDIGGRKPRTALAALLVAGGEVVSVDRLVDIVWGDIPPESAGSALRAYMSRLRRALGSGAVLEHRSPGYRLALDHSTVDAVEFEWLVNAARAAAVQGDLARAVSDFEAALALWRGDALAEFVDEDFAAAETRRLTELRTATTEERIGVLLQLGRAADVVPELEALVLRRPTRERSAAALMRALYATGRQADALAAYQDLRHRLVEELGVEPAATTQEMYHRILLQDPALTTLQALGNLPRRVGGFVGRQPEIDGVVQALRTGPLVTALGVGGVGKTRLALEVATRVRRVFADGAWWCEFGSLPDDGPVGQVVAAALGVQQRSGLTIGQTVVEYLRSRTALLVMDNCEHVLAPAARLAAHIIDSCPTVVVLTTSRQPLGIDGEQVWPVAPLPVADATSLFLQRARTSTPGFSVDPVNADTVRNICERLDGLPLAIELAAARIRVMTPEEISRRLDRTLLLAGGPAATPRHHSLAATVEWSFRLLPPTEQMLFRNMSVFAGGADLRAVHRVAAPTLTEDLALDRLIGLVDRSMVVPVPGSPHSRYRMLETLRAYGHSLATADEADGELARRHAVHYVELAEQTATGLQGPDERAWVDQALPDYDNLRAAYRNALAEEDIDLAMRMVTALPELVHLRIGYEASEWSEHLLESVDPDDPRYPAAVGFAARGAWNRGDFRRARDLARLAEDRDPPFGTARMAYPRDVLADVSLPEGDADFTLRYYAAESDRARTRSDAIRLVWSLHCFAVCQAVCRQSHLGVPAARESLEVADGTANPTSMATARYALGLVLKKVQPERALTLLEEAAEIAGSVRNRWWEGVALMESAAIRAVHGDPQAAARAFIQVLDHWDRIGDRTQQWQNLRYVARLLRRLDAAAGEELLSILKAAGEQASITPRASVSVAPATATQSTAVLRARAMLDRRA